MDLFSSKHLRKFFFVVFAIVIAMVTWLFYAAAETKRHVQLEFDITQNERMILFSEFGEPAQFAIWLEDPDNGVLKTVFVTHRTAANDWIGKTDCPDSLPLWRSLFKQGTSSFQSNAFEKFFCDAVTGATPQEGHFKIRAEVAPDSKWICWIEVNLAGDFNEEYPCFNEKTGVIDTHYMGQPALVYRVGVTASVNKSFIPKLFGMTIYNDKSQIIQPLKGITTAKDIFSDISIRVIRPKPKLIE